MTPEVEIKFACGPETLEALAVRAAQVPGKDRRLVSVYYDTPDRALASRGASLRLRTDGTGRTVQTFKTGEGLGRLEAEVETAPGRLELAGAELGALLPPDDLSRLSPRFTVQVRRRTFEVAHGSSRIELALDAGEIQAGNARETICEAELELISGAPGDLFDLALGWVSELPLALSLRSKSGRGDRLAGGDGRHERLPPGQTCGEVVRRALLGALSGTCERVLEAAADPTPEAVHGLRVALRRQRSLMAVFRSRLEPGETAATRRGLRTLSQACSLARELDVLIAEADPAGALHVELSAARKKAAAGLVQTLESAAARRTLLEALILTESGDWRGRPENTRPAGDLLGDLARRWRQVRRLGARFDVLDAGERHDLRLRIKALRYVLEGLDAAELAELRRVLSPALRDAQDALGADNDGEAARSRLEALDLSRTARREAARLVARLRRKGARARAGRAVRRLLEAGAGPLT